MFVVVSRRARVLRRIERVHEALELLRPRLVRPARVELGHVARLVRHDWLCCVLLGHVGLLVPQFALSVLLAQLLGNVVASVADLRVLLSDLGAEGVFQLQVGYEVFLVVVLEAACERPAVYVMERIEGKIQNSGFSAVGLRQELLQAVCRHHGPVDLGDLVRGLSDELRGVGVGVEGDHGASVSCGADLGVAEQLLARKRETVRLVRFLSRSVHVGGGPPVFFFTLHLLDDLRIAWERHKAALRVLAQTDKVAIQEVTVLVTVKIIEN